MKDNTEQIICCICEKPITEIQMDIRHWLHEEDCPNRAGMTEQACECDLECHAECCPQCNDDFGVREKL